MSTTDIPDTAAAQARIDAISGFDAELERLEAAGLAPDPAWRARVAAHHAQLAAAITARHDIDRDARSRQLSLGLRIVSFLGAVALAAALYYLSLQFWPLLPTAAQAGTLIGAALAALGVAALVARRDRSGYFTKLAALAACTCFMLDLALLAQIFNLGLARIILLAWAAFALALACAWDVRLLLVLAIACIAVFVGAESGTFRGAYWLGLGHRPERYFIASALLGCVPLLPLRARPGFAATWRIGALLCLFLPILVLSFWGAGSLLPLRPASIELLYQLAGFALAAGAIWLGIRRGWPDTSTTGAVFFCIFLYARFFDWWWDWLPKYLFFLLLALSALVLLFLFTRWRRAALRKVARS